MKTRGKKRKIYVEINRKQRADSRCTYRESSSSVNRKQWSTFFEAGTKSLDRSLDTPSMSVIIAKLRRRRGKVMNTRVFARVSICCAI